MYIVINGGGKVGEYLATILLRHGNEVAIIEQNGRLATKLSAKLDGKYLIVCGDGCDSKYLEDAGIRRADVFVAATGQDENNLVSSEIAKRVYLVDRCIARVNSPNNLKIFSEVNIEAVSSTALIAGLIEEEALGGSMEAMLSLIQGSVMMSKFRVVRLKNHSDEDGVAVGDVDMPNDCNIVAVSADDDMEIATRKTRIFPGDDVIVASNTDMVDAARRVIKAL